MEYQIGTLNHNYLYRLFIYKIENNFVYKEIGYCKERPTIDEVPNRNFLTPSGNYILITKFIEFNITDLNTTKENIEFLRSLTGKNINIMFEDMENGNFYMLSSIYINKELSIESNSYNNYNITGKYQIHSSESFVEIPNYFIATWDTRQQGGYGSPDKHLILSFKNAVEYLFIEWGDGNTENFHNVSEVSHIYPSVDNYTIKILSSSFTLNTYFTDIRKLKNIESYGNYYIMATSFKDAINLESIPDNVKIIDTSLLSLFNKAIKFNSNINNWDVSNVQNFIFTFYKANSFNYPLDKWNVSNSSSFSSTFADAFVFNQPINNWDVSNSKSFYRMFLNAFEFNQLLDKWNVSNSINFTYMFYRAYKFDQNLGMWNMTNARYMNKMLSYCGMSIENYNATLIGWESQNVPNNIELGAEGLHATGEGALARQRLVNNHNWHIVDGDGDHHQ